MEIKKLLELASKGAKKYFEQKPNAKTFATYKQLENLLVDYKKIDIAKKQDLKLADKTSVSFAQMVNFAILGNEECSNFLVKKVQYNELYALYYLFYGHSYSEDYLE